MFALYAFLVALCLTIIEFLFIKTFQLEGYKIDNYLLKVFKFQFAIGVKNKLVFTKRVIRLILCCFILNCGLFLLCYGVIFAFWLNFVLSFVLFLGSPILVVVGFAVMMPVEYAIKNHYIKKAKKRLSQVKCKKIAITGSFGKTSTKNILYQILKEEFDVCATPKSYNTPMGVCKTILEELKDTDDFFIVEMGARKIGDIEYLAKLVGVDFAILTPVGNCHLETFGSLENIQNAKYELCKEAKSGVIFNGNSKGTKALFERYGRRKYLVCDDKGFAYVKNVETTCEGSQISLIIDGKELSCKTRLLGNANLDNIVVAVAMAYLLGESMFNIRRGIEKLKPTPHRLELIKGEVVNVIDDSYNSNFDGFKQALEVLKLFPGKKVVVSPGIVELGYEQEQINFQIAEEVAKVADCFIIMNETNKKALFSGACAGGMKEEQIMFAKTRNEQKMRLKEVVEVGGVVLFENDLPDNFK